MSSYFVTGSGTDVGKTFAACGLLHGARKAGYATQAYKPVAAGIEHAAEGDAPELLAALGRAVTEEEAALLNPWRFKAPMAPNMAAKLEGRPIDFEALVAWTRGVMQATQGLTLIEGVGGLMVPLDDTHTVRDWMVALGLPVVLVTGSYLGALNHTLMTLELLRAAKLKVAALVISESADTGVPLAGTLATIRGFAHDIPLIIAQARVSSWKEAAALHVLGEKLV